MCLGDLSPLFLSEISQWGVRLTFHFQVDKGNERGFTYHATKPCTSFERDKLFKTPQYPSTSNYLPLGWHKGKGKRLLTITTQD